MHILGMLFLGLIGTITVAVTVWCFILSYQVVDDFKNINSHDREINHD